MKKFNMNLITDGNQVFDVELEDLGFSVVMRPYTVKESKGIMESKIRGNQSDVTKLTLQSCFIDTKPHQNNFNILDLPIYDTEKIMVSLFVQSLASSKLPVIYECHNKVPDPLSEDGEEKICGNKIKFMVDTSKNFIPLLKEEDKILKVNDNVTIQLKVPTLFEMMESDLEDPEDLFNIMINCIGSVIDNTTDTIYTHDELIDESDGGANQLVEIFDSLNQSNVADIINFVNNIPRVTNIIKLKCPECGHEEEIVLSGLMDFLI